MDQNTHRQPAVGSLEKQIEAWRAHLRKSQTITSQDAAELEDHLREQIASLGADGLSDDEAFLVAVKRMGAIDALTREFAREHSDRLWKQLVLSGDEGHGDAGSPATGLVPEDVGRPRPGRGGGRGDQGPGPLRDRLRRRTTARSIRSTSASSRFPSSPRTSRGTGRCRDRAGCGWPRSSPWRLSS